jgi:hypothetical protein
MNRTKQLWFLIGLSALTATAQYIVQGAMASGGAPELFNQYFWYIDYGLWGLRSLIEAWVIVYLFQTTGKTAAQRYVLIGFEIALITLITLTLGPALYALTTGQHIAATMTAISLRYWTYGVAAYTSLMMGSAGFAYRVQPISEDSKLIANNEYEKLQSENEILSQKTIEFDEITHERDLAVGQLSDSRGELEDIQERLQEITKVADNLQSQVKDLETAKKRLEYELQHIDEAIQPVKIGKAVKAILKQYLNGDFDYDNLEIPRMIGEILNTSKTAVVRGWNQSEE